MRTRNNPGLVFIIMTLSAGWWWYSNTLHFTLLHCLLNSWTNHIFYTLHELFTFCLELSHFKHDFLWFLQHYLNVNFCSQSLQNTNWVNILLSSSTELSTHSKTKLKLCKDLSIKCISSLIRAEIENANSLLKDPNVLWTAILIPTRENLRVEDISAIRLMQEWI